MFPLAVVFRHVFCGVFFFFFSRLCCPIDSKTPHRPACERVSYCLEISPASQLPPQDQSLSLTLLSLFLSFMFCPTFFQGEWAAFLGTWCLPLVFRNWFVEVAQHSYDLWWICGREVSYSSHPIPPPSWYCLYSFLILFCWSIVYPLHCCIFLCVSQVKLVRTCTSLKLLLCLIQRYARNTC